MSILVDKNTRLLVQGITGKAGGFHARGCRDYGTNVVAGVTPGRGGELFEDTIPVFDTVSEARQQTDCNATMIFVPAPGAADAILEAAEAGIELIVCITEGIPVHDMMRVKVALKEASRLKPIGCSDSISESKFSTNHELQPSPGEDGHTNSPCRVKLIGPNCPGIITPGQCKIGIMPGYIHHPGSIGVVSRSGTLTYEAVWQLTSRGLGQSTCIGIGGDPIHGMTHTDALRLLNKDPGTEAIVLIGEIGGSGEEEAAAWIQEHCQKPVVAFIAGATAPEGRRMGHAGAIIQGSSGTAEGKKEALRAAGVAIAESPADIAQTLIEALKRK
ncbi:MAG: succinate--CoA ligase subunit alpha [Chthoniobacterales bacterium]|nr:succinate--CoA ligase subunit alpha [Chthoniobacterales bacterium]